jgi:hypothetical protein
MSSSDRKKVTQKPRVAVYFSEEEYAELVRKAGGRSLSEMCRERILLSANYRDPLFDVCAKMNASAAQMKRLREVLKRWNEEKWDVLLGGPDVRHIEVDPQFLEDVNEAFRIIGKSLKLAEKASQAISSRVQTDRVIQHTKSGKPRP